MATISVLDSTGATKTVQLPNANGRAAATASRPVALSNEDKAALDLVATEATLSTVAADIATINTKLDTLATQTTLTTVAETLDAIHVDEGDLATEATLGNAVTKLGDISDGITSMNTKLDAIAASLASIDSKTPGL